MKNHAFGLILVLTLCALLVAVTHTLTSATIAQNLLSAQQAQLQELLPGTQLPAHLQWQNNQLIRCDKTKATITSVNRITTQGYGGAIKLLVAFKDNIVQGVRVVSHRETPGLGDFIDTARSPWIQIFAGLTTNALADDVDVITGATITRNAVVNGVDKAVATGGWSCS